MKNRIIEPSRSPWRAQIVVSKDPTGKHKKRLCIDYSTTVNLYTHADAYPLPRIDILINDLAHYKYYSTFDLKSAYHQIGIREEDRQKTAFEANGKLYHFRRVPFGVTNGVAVFQRVVDALVEEEELEGVFVYLDNVTIAGRTQNEHDKNVKKFLEVAKRKNLTLNENKTISSVTSLDVLGYRVEFGTIKPDPERMKPLEKLLPPENKKAMQRLLGMFAYYSKWIPNFSEEAYVLFKATEFPLGEVELAALERLKFLLK